MTSPKKWNIRGKILWTNPNPTAGFPAQTITLNSDDYDTYKVYYNKQTLYKQADSYYDVSNNNTDFKIKYDFIELYFFTCGVKGFANVV